MILSWGKLEYLVQPCINQPGVPLLVYPEPVWHVQQARTKAGLDSTSSSIKSQDCVLLYHPLVSENIVPVIRESTPCDRSSVQDDRIIVKVHINSNNLSQVKLVIPARNLNKMS